MRALTGRIAAVASADNDVNPGRVLVVNSNAIVLARISSLLDGAGFAVTLCRTAAEALTALAIDAPAAMVVDFMLDDMSGFALVHACEDAGTRVPTVMTAGRGEVGAAVRAVREGVADFLPGTVDGRVVQAIRRALRQAGKG